MLGVKWDNKLQSWIVYERSNGKVMKRCESEKQAKRYLSILRDEEESTPPKRKHY